MAVSLAFTTDNWTSRANRGYRSYIGHILTSNFETRNYYLSIGNVDQSHTAVCLAKSIPDQIAVWTTEVQRNGNVTEVTTKNL